MLLGLIEHDGGALAEASLEMLTLARRLTGELNTPLEAVLVGSEALPLTDRVKRYGVSRVHLVQHEALDEYAPGAWAAAVAQLAQSLSPRAIAAAGTDRGSEVLAHVAARLDKPLAAQCVEVRPGEDVWQVTRLRWGGSLLEEAELDPGGGPALFTAAPHAVPAEEVPIQDVTIEEFTPDLDDRDLVVKVAKRVASEREGVSLEDARVVVGGGRGVGGAEGFQMLAELANLLGGAVGGSRVATNNGWRPHADQIGQTGVQIAPDVYIACGISGAIQHMVGVKGAKRILAVNKDPDAPIISRSDYAVIGDLHEIVPAIIEELKKTK